MPSKNSTAPHEAETIALRALAFLAADTDRMGRFLALSGIGPTELRSQAGNPAMLCGILEYMMQDETLLIVFAAEAGLTPENVTAAHATLAGPPPEYSV
ncbi:MAG: DUF3572 domain-containing protein [Hyphomicrobiaceae bacterium]